MRRVVPILWLALVCTLALLSLAMPSRSTSTDWDTSLFPPGATTADAQARSVVTTLLADNRTEIDPRRLARYADSLTEPQAADLRDALASFSAPIPRDVAEQLLADALGAGPYTYRFGTDYIGRDVGRQLLLGARTALLVGLVAAGIALALGIVIGMAMGLGGRWLDSALMRLTEAVMSVPLLYVLVLAAGLLPRNTLVVMAIIGCLSWHGAARYIRAECMKLRDSDFVQSARAGGASLPRIALRHILPNAAAPVIVDTSFAIAGAILVEATLSFLGLGAGDRASWGTLMRDATAGGAGFNWWLGVFPGVMIFTTALSLVLLGESLRDALDPRSRETSAQAWTYTARA